MQKLGLDLGTTNSALSYKNAEGLIDSFALGAQEVQYVPSWLALPRDGRPVVKIGLDARSAASQTSEYIAFSRFKMFLGEESRDLLGSNGFSEHSPELVTSLFIDELIKRYRTQMVVTQNIERLLVTMPEIWARGDFRHPAREALKRAVTNLGIPIRIGSEPVAATAFFLHKQALKRKPFSGHVLVCDCGGGTIDFSLSKVDGDHIEVLEGTGRGRIEQGLIGRAGVAYDHAVIERLYGEKLSAAKTLRITKEFEEHKIHGATDYISKLERFLKNELLDTAVFSLDDDSQIVKASDMILPFRNVVKTGIVESLALMEKKMEALGVDSQNYERFRVLMVGGFSNFYLVQSIIKLFFKCEDEFDLRFADGMSVREKSLAISQGAAILATESVKETQTSPVSVGIKGVTGDVPLLTKGQKLSDCSVPKFKSFQLLSPQSLDQGITLFVDSGDKRHYYNLGQSGTLASMLPSIPSENQNASGAFWQGDVSVTMDDEFFFCVHIRDGVSKQEKRTSLGEILHRVKQTGDK
jgi:molecular chaperone DnaK